MARPAAQPVLQDDRGHLVLAGRAAAVHRAGHRDEAGHAAAYRVALVVDGALRVLAARRGVAGAAGILK